MISGRLAAQGSQATEKQGSKLRPFGWVNVTLDLKAIIKSGMEQREPPTLECAYRVIGKTRMSIYTTAATLTLTVRRNEAPRRTILHHCAHISRIVVGSPIPHLNQVKSRKELVHLCIRSRNSACYQTLEISSPVEPDFGLLEAPGIPRPKGKLLGKCECEG